jgi:hypothetical protein
MAQKSTLALDGGPTIKRAGGGFGGKTPSDGSEDIEDDKKYGPRRKSGLGPR